jgi:hypothetical protein
MPLVPQGCRAPPEVPMLLRDQGEHLLEFGQSGLERVHQRVAAPERRNLSHPMMAAYGLM